MFNWFNQYLARRRMAAAWASYKLSQWHVRPRGWLRRHLVHHEIFRQYMRRAAALQKAGFFL